MSKENKSISSFETIRVFFKVGACSTTLCNVVDRGFGYALETEEQAALYLAGGIAGCGYQCGQIWGAALAAGAQAFHLLGPGPRAEAAAVLASRRLIAAFRGRHKEINCRALTATDWKDSKQVTRYMLKGGPARCFLMAGSYSPRAFREINAAFSEPLGETGCSPLSCTALLAQKAGQSDLHTVMAAGLAGGIGLSGGACGALGAALWMIALRESMGSFEFDHPRIQALIDGFKRITDGEVDCALIAGRKFADVDDHAAYLRAGGCAAIIESLAAQVANLELQGQAS
jgi:hypothetical protein